MESDLKTQPKRCVITIKFSNSVGYKINIQKSFEFLYTNNKAAEKEITVSFSLASESIKILQNKFK